MTAPGWLSAAVRAHPRRFPFVVAARILGDTARLRADPGLGFAACECLAVEEGEPPVLVTTALSLAGPDSPLPVAWAEALAALDPASAARGAIDAVEHRLLALLATIGTRRAVDDPTMYAVLVRACAALAESEAAELAGRCADGPTAEAVAARVALAADAPVRVIAACRGVLPVPEGLRLVLGGQRRLGQDTALGEAVPAPDIGFAVEIGPVAWDVAAELRPQGCRHRAVVEVVTTAAPPATTWEIRLLVDTRNAPRPGLGTGTLAYDAWLDGIGSSERMTEVIARGIG